MNNFLLALLVSNLMLANNGRLSSIKIPSSRFITNILIKLFKSGFILGIGKERYHAVVYLKYINSKPSFKDISLISKPTKRIYISYRALIKNYRGAYLLLSTKAGLLTREEALSLRIGGLVLFQIW